jgi:hypothetical protein
LDSDVIDAGQLACGGIQLYLKIVMRVQLGCLGTCGKTKYNQWDTG